MREESKKRKFDSESDETQKFRRKLPQINKEIRAIDEHTYSTYIKNLFKESKYGEVINLCKKNLEKNPNSIFEIYNLTLAYFYKGNYQISIIYCDKVFKLYSEILEQDIEDEEYRVYQKALKLKEEFLNFIETEESSYNKNINALFNGHKFDESIILCKKYLNKNPNSIHINYHIAHIYFHKKDYKTSHEYCDKALKLCNELFELGIEHQVYQKALGLKEKLIIEEEHTLNRTVNRHFKKCKFDKAIILCEELLGKNPNSIPVKYNIALAYFKRNPKNSEENPKIKDYEISYKYCNEILKQDSSHPLSKEVIELKKFSKSRFLEEGMHIMQKKYIKNVSFIIKDEYNYNKQTLPYLKEFATIICKLNNISCDDIYSKIYSKKDLDLKESYISELMKIIENSLELKYEITNDSKKRLLESIALAQSFASSITPKKNEFEKETAVASYIYKCVDYIETSFKIFEIIESNQQEFNTRNKRSGRTLYIDSITTYLSQLNDQNPLKKEALDCLEKELLKKGREAFLTYLVSISHSLLLSGERNKLEELYKKWEKYPDCREKIWPYIKIAFPKGFDEPASNTALIKNSQVSGEKKPQASLETHYWRTKVTSQSTTNLPERASELLCSESIDLNTNTQKGDESAYGSPLPSAPILTGSVPTRPNYSGAILNSNYPNNSQQPITQQESPKRINYLEDILGFNYPSNLQPPIRGR